MVRGGLEESPRFLYTVLPFGPSDFPCSAYTDSPLRREYHGGRIFEARGVQWVNHNKELRHGVAATLIRRLQEAVEAFEKASLAEFVELYNRPWRMLYLSFLSGVARGFGIAIGLTLVTPLFVALMIRLAQLNLPVIGEFFASIAKIVASEMKAVP